MHFTIAMCSNQIIESHSNLYAAAISRDFSTSYVHTFELSNPYKLKIRYNLPNTALDWPGLGCTVKSGTVKI